MELGVLGASAFFFTTLRLLAFAFAFPFTLALALAFGLADGDVSAGAWHLDPSNRPERNKHSLTLE